MVAIDPAWQGRGVGSAIATQLAQETATYQLRALTTIRVTFYERLGWQRWRGPFTVQGTDGPHNPLAGTVMIMPTHLTPPLDLDSLLTAEAGNGGHW